MELNAVFHQSDLYEPELIHIQQQNPLSLVSTNSAEVAYTVIGEQFNSFPLFIHVSPKFFKRPRAKRGLVEGFDALLPSDIVAKKT